MFDTSAHNGNELNELVGELYQSALSGKWSGVLHRIAAATHSNKAFFYLHQVSQDNPMMIEVASTLDYPANAVRHYQMHHKEDPYYAVTRTMSEGDLLCLNDFIDIDEYKDTAFYQSILKPMDAGKVLGVCLIRDGRYESMFVINRGFDDPAYSENDRALMSILSPHLRRAIQIGKELRLFRQYVSISRSILDQQNKAIAVCDADARTLSLNQFAQKHLVNSAAVFTQDGVLLTHSPVMTKRLHHHIRQCAAQHYTDVGTQESLVLESDNHTEAVLVISPLSREPELIEFDVPCALVTVTFQQTFNWQRVVNEYAVTPAQLALLKDLQSKKSLKRIAADTGRAYNTLRVHMQQIYRKFGVSSQIELMVKLSALRG